MNKKILKILLAIFLIFLFLLIIYFFNPEKFKFYPFCIFHKITGFYCAGCGSIRATYWLLHGDILKAIDYNVLFVLSLQFFFIYTIYKILEIFFQKKLIKEIKVSNKLIIFLILIVIAYTILRNIKVYPFLLLAP